MPVLTKSSSETAAGSHLSSPYQGLGNSLSLTTAEFSVKSNLMLFDARTTGLLFSYRSYYAKGLERRKTGKTYFWQKSELILNIDLLYLCNAKVCAFLCVRPTKGRRCSLK